MVFRIFKCIYLFTDLNDFYDYQSPVILDLVNILTLGASSVDVSETSNVSTNSETLKNEIPNLLSSSKVNESPNERFLERERGLV